MSVTDYERLQALIAEESWYRPSSAIVPLVNPAAGASRAYSPPGSEITLVRSVTCLLATSVTVAARVPTLTFSYADGTVFGVFPSDFTVAASKTVRVTWGIGLAISGANDGPYINVPIPEYRLEVGNTLTIGADAIDTTDQLSGCVVTVEQWPVRAPIGN